MASNATQLGLGMLVAAAIGVATVAVAPRFTGGAEEETTPAMAAVDEVPAETPEPATTAEAAPEDDQPDVEEVAATAPVEPNRPELESFYMAPDGFATIAGRAEAGQAVAIMVAGDRVADVQADGTGAFAAAVLLDASDQPRRLSLLADPDGAAIASAGSIMVAPTRTEEQPAADGPVVVGAVTDTVIEPAPDQNAASEDEPAPTTDVAAADPVEEPATDAAPAEEPVIAAADTPSEQPAAEEEPVAEVRADVADDAVETTTADAGASAAPPQDDLAAAVSGPENTDTAAAPAAEVAVAPETNAEPDAPTVAEAPAEPEEVVVAEEPAPEPAPTEAEPAAPTVIVADTDGVRVVQDSRGPQVLSSIALDTITYDPEGEVVLGGRATGDGFVQVYINNQPVQTTRIEAGNWQTDLPDIDTGVYTLRVDEVDAEGAVVSRIETPFKREEPEAVVAVLAEETAEDGFDVAVRTVQPGMTLWAIAQEEMGEGIMYVAVYEANRDLIRDPDLIYPGQVFRIPEMPEDQ